MAPTDPAGAGRHADRPVGIPAAGWKAVAVRVVGELKRDHVSLLAAGVAFKSLLALFPALIAAISIWGLIADPREVSDRLAGFTAALPQGVDELLQDQMSQIAGGDPQTLSLALVASVLLALWSASGGLAGLVEGCNAAYDEVDRRSFLVRRGLALLLTLGGICFVIVTVGVIAVLPVALRTVGLGSAAQLTIRVGQWPALAVMVMVALAVVYKVAPDRASPRLWWVSPGAAVATVLWLLGSAVFTLYVESFGSFGETYGTFAGIIVLMLWLFLTAFVVLLGAEINAEAERQTARDTTVGGPAPLGRRGAAVADTTPDERGRG